MLSNVVPLTGYGRGSCHAWCMATSHIFTATARGVLWEAVLDIRNFPRRNVLRQHLQDRPRDLFRFHAPIIPEIVPNRGEKCGFMPHLLRFPVGVHPS